MKSKIKEINQFLEKFNWLDFQVFQSSNSEGDTAVLHGSADFSYYHNIEIKVEGLELMCLPVCWTCEPSQAPAIKLYEKDSAAWKSVAGFLNFQTLTDIIAFSNDEGINIFCIAGDIKFDCTTVYYYQRDNLERNEKIADWVASVKR